MTPRPDLADYARTELRGEAVYRGYRPKSSVLDEVQAAWPQAHVVIVSGAWCADCRMQVPKLARILEELPDSWSVELHQDDDDTRETYDVLAVPSFIVLDRPMGRELGRIIESPASDDGFEGDLLEIAQAARLTRA
jgi:thiol-disulfide isomerase/thioredoxin